MLSPYFGGRPLGKGLGRFLLLLTWSGLLILLLSSFSPISLARSVSGSALAASNTATKLVSGAPARLSSSNGATTLATTFPAYNDVWGIATHNTYWVNRGDNEDTGASGAQEVLSDQLLHEHIRAIELDIHSEGVPAHQWRVYHTSDAEDFSCDPLSECLKMLQMFQYEAPQHEVFNIVIELKNTSPKTAYLMHDPVNHNFDADHTIQDLDTLLRTYLGDWLYTPKDFLSRCSNATVLTDCMKSNGWPTIDQLRGKFIFTIEGNWGTNAQDWADYATTDTANRVAFPMFSFLNTTGPNDSHAVNVGNGITAEDWSTDSHIQEVFPPQNENQAAFNQSIFWQFEPFDNSQAVSALGTFIGTQHGVVRGGDSFTVSDQKARLALHIQMIQTDYPWAAIDTGHPAGIPVDPSQRLYNFSAVDGTSPPGPNIIEPGDRYYFSTAESETVFAYSTLPATSSSWLETTVSTTRVGNPWERCDGVLGLSSCEQTGFPRKARDTNTGVTPVEGCVRAESSPVDFVEICRQKQDSSACCAPNQEQVSVFVRVAINGQGVPVNQKFDADRFRTCETPPPTDPQKLCVGNTIALSVINQGSGSSVQVLTAYNTDGAGNPQWQTLLTQQMSAPLTKLGLSAQEDVLFTGTNLSTSAGSNVPKTCGDPIILSSLSGREALSGATVLPGPKDYTVADLSAGDPNPGPGGLSCEDLSGPHLPI